MARVQIMLDNLLLGRELLRGVVMGMAIAAPVGPIGILCIRRTLLQGWWTGLLSGLGAATADGLYGCVAGLGLVAVSNALVAQQIPLRLVGGVFLIGLGIKSWTANNLVETRSPVSRQKAGVTQQVGVTQQAGAASHPFSGSITRQRLFSAYASTLVLTLTNPATILAFLAIFTGLGITSTATDQGQALALISGVFLGSVLWWLFLSTVTHHLRSYLSRRWLRWINYGSGLVMVGFGGLALVSTVFSEIA